MNKQSTLLWFGLVVLIAFALSPAGTECRAEVMWLGPTPYLSAADSPFPVDGSNPNFFLEDFEDGDLNTPGIFQPLHNAFGDLWHGEVVVPSESTDSVDADDGILDGSGAGGHSFRSRSWVYSPLGPVVSNSVSFRFQFDQAELGFLPNAFGLVWTDGPLGIAHISHPWLDLRLTVTDAEGNRSLSPYVNVEPTVNSGREGQTSEDFFLGVISDTPISEVSFFGVYYTASEPVRDYLEIDHVQYGQGSLPPPEPDPDMDGDFDGNGIVDQHDLDLVLAHWGNPPTDLPTNWDNNRPLRNVDQIHLNNVLTTWGNVAAPRLGNAVAIPEPPSHTLLLSMFTATAISNLASARRRLGLRLRVSRR